MPQTREATQAPRPPGLRVGPAQHTSVVEREVACANAREHVAVRDEETYPRRARGSSPIWPTRQQVPTCPRARIRAVPSANVRTTASPRRAQAKRRAQTKVRPFLPLIRRHSLLSACPRTRAYSQVRRHRRAQNAKASKPPRCHWREQPQQHTLASNDIVARHLGARRGLCAQGAPCRPNSLARTFQRR